MNASAVFFWSVSLAATWLGLVATWLAAVALLRTFVERCRVAYAMRSGTTVLLGAAIALPTAFLALALLKGGPPLLKLVGLALLAALLGAAVTGSAGLADRIGGGLGASVDAAEPWRRVARGGAVLGLSFLVPVLGWFALLPGALLSGVGACVIARGVRLAPAVADSPAAPA